MKGKFIVTRYVTVEQSRVVRANNNIEAVNLVKDAERGWKWVDTKQWSAKHEVTPILK
jgi:hypothetical protein